MNFSTISRQLSALLCCFLVAQVSCLGMAYVQGELLDTQMLLNWGTTILVTTISALGSFFVGRISAPNKGIGRKEALCLIGISWILCTLLGAMPFWLIVPEASLADAIFECASGLSTTGLTIFQDVEILPKSLLYWRALTQWIGGLGFVIFFVGMLQFASLNTKRLLNYEFSGPIGDFESSRIQEGILKILLIYGLFTMLCIVALYLEGMSAFDAVCHSFSALSTGGFSTHNGSYAYFKSPAIEYTTILFMLIGGASFLLWVQIFQGKWAQSYKHAEARGYLIIVGIATLCVTAIITLSYKSFSGTEAFRAALFQVVSTMTTTGFTSFDYDQVAPGVDVIFYILMFIGGCSGSTAGGLKVYRVLTLGKIVLYQIRKTFQPRLIEAVKLNGKPLSDAFQTKVANFFIINVFVFWIGVWLVALLEPYMSFQGNFSCVITSLSNVGVGFAEIGPTRNCAFLTPETKVLLAFLMLLGRLEFFTLLVFVMPSFWRRF